MNKDAQLQKLNEDIENCEQCPADNRFQHEFGWGPVGKIMFVGQCPSFGNPTGKQGTSEFDEFFLKLLEGTGITLDDFYFTNLVKIPVEINKVEGSILEHCATHLLDEIEIVQPKFIFCLGKFSYQFLKKAGARVYSVMHPGAIRYGRINKETGLREQVTLDDWRKEFNTLLEKLNVNKSLGKEQDV